MKTIFNRRLSGLLAATAFLCTATLAHALPEWRNVVQAFGQGTDKTDVMADNAEYSFSKTGPDANWTTFSGNVAIRHRGYELRADKIRYNAETGDAEAVGNVVLIGTDGTLWKGESLNVNLRERAGSASGIDLYSKPFRVLAEGGSFDTLVKSNQCYEVQNAIITTCTNEVGHFHYAVKANRVRLRPHDDVTAWGVYPELFGIPFFYRPWFWKDLLNHYGFRFQPGYKGSWGAYLLSTYKFPILRDKENYAYIDSYTFADYRSKRGWAFGEKIKWDFADPLTKIKESQGFITGYYIPDDHDLPEELDPEDTERYRIRLQHSWNATDRDQVLIQALYVSDTRIQRDFFRKEYREMTEPDNFATYTHYGDLSSFGLTARYRLNDFYTQVERLPEAWFSLSSIELGNTGIYLENDTSLAFLRSVYNHDQYGDERDYEAFRADTSFVLSYPGKYFGFLSVVPRFGYRGTYYDKTLEAITTTTMETTVHTNSYGEVYSTSSEKRNTEYREDSAGFRSVFEVGAEVSTRAYGFFTSPSGDTWRHVVEPYMNWTYIPRPNLEPEELYQFDEIDEIDKTHNVRIGVRQRWQQRRLGQTAVSEKFYLDTWVDLDVEPEDDLENFSDFGWDARYYPMSWLRFRTRGYYDNNIEDVDDVEVSMTAWHNAFRSEIGYRYHSDENSLLYGSISWYANERWGYNLFGRYEFETSQVEEVGGWIQRTWDCIAMRFLVGVEPGYTNDRGYDEDDDWHISLTGWLTDFVPNSILEEDNR